MLTKILKQKTDFDVFMSQLSETNANLEFFCDFDKSSAKDEDEIRRIADYYIKSFEELL